jgi:hypothetical protein
MATAAAVQNHRLCRGQNVPTKNHAPWKTSPRSWLLAQGDHSAEPAKQKQPVNSCAEVADAKAGALGKATER